MYPSRSLASFDRIAGNRLYGWRKILAGKLAGRRRRRNEESECVRTKGRANLNKSIKRAGWRRHKLIFFFSFFLSFRFPGWNRPVASVSAGQPPSPSLIDHDPRSCTPVAVAR